MNKDTINFYLEVVHELIERDVPATVENINKHLAPANKEDEIVAALTALVSEGRLVKTTTLATSQRDERSTELERYQLP
jgi:hypothetical protein